MSFAFQVKLFKHPSEVIRIAFFSWFSHFWAELLHFLLKVLMKLESNFSIHILEPQSQFNIIL